MPVYICTRVVTWHSTIGLVRAGSEFYVDIQCIDKMQTNPSIGLELPQQTSQFRMNEDCVQPVSSGRVHICTALCLVTLNSPYASSASLSSIGKPKGRLRSVFSFGGACWAIGSAGLPRYIESCQGWCINAFPPPQWLKRDRGILTFAFHSIIPSRSALNLSRSLMYPTSSRSRLRYTPPYRAWSAEVSSWKLG